MSITVFQQRINGSKIPTGIHQSQKETGPCFTGNNDVPQEKERKRI